MATAALPAISRGIALGDRAACLCCCCRVWVKGTTDSHAHLLHGAAALRPPPHASSQSSAAPPPVHGTPSPQRQRGGSGSSTVLRMGASARVPAAVQHSQVHVQAAHSGRGVAAHVCMNDRMHLGSQRGLLLQTQPVIDAVCSVFAGSLVCCFAGLTCGNL